MSWKLWLLFSKHIYYLAFVIQSNFLICIAILLNQYIYVRPRAKSISSRIRPNIWKSLFGFLCNTLIYFSSCYFYICTFLVYIWNFSILFTYQERALESKWLIITLFVQQVTPPLYAEKRVDRMSVTKHDLDIWSQELI